MNNNGNDGEDRLDPEIEKYIAKKQKWIKEARSIFLIVIIVFTFRSSFFEPYRIPSGSMIPTLMIGDFILVSKLSYGFKVPFSDMSVGRINLNPIYLFGEKQPERGDVIVFKYPEDPRINYIKRLVGLPGDRVRIENKIVYINGKAVTHTPHDGTEIMADMDAGFRNYNFDFFRVNFDDDEDNYHIVQFNKDSFFISSMRERVVPEGHYFVLGDNRDHSADSRAWGFVPHENLRGRALFVWFSMSLPFGQNEFTFRPGRIGTKIQ